MSHQCSDHSCSAGESHHSHGGGGKSCGCSDNCCSCCKCGCHGKNSFAKELLQVADGAWMELLREKIKDQIEANNGAQLDELAKLVSDSNKARWHSKLQKNNDIHNYEQKIEDFFKKGQS